MSNTQKHHNNDSNQTRIALLEQSIGHIDQTLLRIESRMDKMDLKIDKIENRLWHILLIIPTSIITSGIAVIISKMAHWI